MNPFSNLFKRHGLQDTPALQAAITRAVATVEPLLLQAGGYPERYRKPLGVALEYAKRLAASIPGPVTINHESYAHDAFVHALFPDLNAITDAICSSLALQEYQHELPTSGELYAPMGMRRQGRKQGFSYAGNIMATAMIVASNCCTLP